MKSNNTGAVVTAVANKFKADGSKLADFSGDPGGTGSFELLTPDQWNTIVDTGVQIGENKTRYKTGAAMYADEIMPFDVTISMRNEYGQGARFSILGVELLNEGSGMSIDDISTEKACTFVARGISHLEPQEADGTWKGLQ